MIFSVVVLDRLCGPRVSLILPRVVSNISDIFFLSFAGNVNEVARLFDLGLASPFDISDVFGGTALDVSKLCAELKPHRSVDMVKN